MRCTQVFGLNQVARKFLSLHVARTPKRTCPTCHHQEGGEMIAEVYASAREDGMFDDGPDLLRYTLQDGRKFCEIVQAVPWSSGPCIFLCLEDADGKRYGEWTEEEINNA